MQPNCSLQRSRVSNIATVSPEFCHSIDRGAVIPTTVLGGDCIGGSVGVDVGVSRCDSGGLRGIIDGSQRYSSHLEGIVTSGCDSSKVGGSIESFGCVHAVARLLGGASINLVESEPTRRVTSPLALNSG